MAKLIYSAISSLDGFVEDEHGNFDWARVDDETHAFVNELVRPIGTYLYGRRMYETMVFWETVSSGEDQAAVIRDFADTWRGSEKVVFSRTLRTLSSSRTTLERDFDPAAIRQLKQTAAADIAIAGPELAAQALGAGLVDECHLFLNPVILGGGKRALPEKFSAQLQLLDLRPFANGVVHLHYAVSV